MIERVVAAVEARTDPDLVVVARTDALAVEGLTAAIERANRYVEAGADMAFIEAPTSIEQLRVIAREVDAPMVVNIVEGGKTPVLPAAELESMGFRLILYANAVLRMAIAGACRALQVLRRTGSTLDVSNEMTSWQQRQDAVALGGWLSLEQMVAARLNARHPAAANEVLPGQAG
jgi:2-methylisocitrate lyase-like PEP mutase family enzyme